MILIKGGAIIDGTGKPAYKADVLLKGNKIAAIGAFPQKQAEETIDALGLYVAPGFVDVNTDVDHYLTVFTNPSQQDFLTQGVTSIIGGHCGASLAPLLYGSLESIRKWANPNAVNVDWHTMGELLRALGSRKLGVNFGTMVGHSTIRRALIGETMRDLTVRELEVFKYLITEALEEGALGFSTGLGYAHSRQTPYAEIKTLLEPVARAGAVYATHLRDERRELAASVAETVRIARETGAKTLISHLRPLLGFEKQFRTAVALLYDATTPQNIFFNGYPYDTSVVPMYTLPPQWAQNGGFDVMKRHLHDAHTRERIMNELKDIRGDAITIAAAIGEAGFDHLIGKTLTDFAAHEELPIPEALLK